jgi:hypothetical protein
MWIFAIAAAQAAPQLASVGERVDLDLPGRHARPFLDAEGQWWLGFGRSGSFHAVPLDPDGAVEREAQRTLVRLDDGVDHGLAACPDGGWLHVASRHGAERDDSAIATRLDADGAQRAQRAVVTNSTTLATNDMAVVCGEGLEAVGFAQRGVKGEGGDEGDWLFLLDDAFFSGAPPEQVDLSESTRITGNALDWSPDPGRLLVFGMERDIGLRVAEFGPELGFVTHHDAPAMPPAPAVGWWSQGVARYDDHVLVVHMMGDPTTPWNLDTGDVGLAVLDSDLKVVSHHQLTQVPPPDGAMRPSIAVQGDRAVVTFDVGGDIQMVTVTLEPSTAADGGEGGDGASGHDDPSPDASGADTAIASRGDASSACSCDTGALGAAVWCLPVLAWRRRRRR